VARGRPSTASRTGRNSTTLPSFGQHVHRPLRLGHVVSHGVHRDLAGLGYQPRSCDSQSGSLLAAGFILTVHFFNSHFRLEKLPLDTVMFSGRITEAELKHERGRQYDRLVARGGSRTSKPRVPGPSRGSTLPTPLA